jgi:hypothetical protein
VKVLFLATREWKNPEAAGGDIQMWECARLLAFREHGVVLLQSEMEGPPW